MRLKVESVGYNVEGHQNIYRRCCGIKIENYICIIFLKYFICIFELGVIGNMVGRTSTDIAKAQKKFF
jgi:hypothetical protein